MPHIPVLYDQVIERADVSPGELWVDCTLGRGGHTLGLLERGAKVIAFDQDLQALHETGFTLKHYVHGGQLTLVHNNFRSLDRVLNTFELDKVDGILADLGVSSPQLDEASRGFSFMASGPLDMRMDRSTGLTALEWIQRHDVSELIEIFRKYGEEPRAPYLARKVKDWASEGGEDTLSLARCIETATPMKIRRKQTKHPATRIFQALRIAVNDELGALERLLKIAPTCLKLGGRLLLISFHSLEDRLIKQTFKSLSEAPPPPRRGLPPPPHPPILFSHQPKKGLTASVTECESNPRSRSARLRILTKIRALEGMEDSPQQKTKSKVSRKPYKRQLSTQESYGS